MFFRYLYTLECFSCSLANSCLNARFSDVLKIIWLLWMLFGAVAVLEIRQPLSALGFIKLANTSGKVNSLFAECNVRLALGWLSAYRSGHQAAGALKQPCAGEINRQNRTLMLKTRAGLHAVLHGHNLGIGLGLLLVGFSERRGCCFPAGRANCG